MDVRNARLLVLCSVLILLSLITQALAQDKDSAQGTIPVGTKITMQNWQQYKQFMPDGMIALFDGKHFWKMPSDVEMDIGPTRIFPPPPGYVAATEKYGGQTQVVVLPNGHYDMKNYVGGAPFPDPTEPYKGWKILADDWFGPRPWIIAATPDTGPITGCTHDRFNNIACGKSVLVYRQVAFLAYPGHPATEPGANGAYYTEWAMVLIPEQLKYLTRLTIFYQDTSREEDEYLFVPAFRRTLRTSTTSRCAPVGGGDFTKDDLRGGFNGGVAIFQAQFLRDQKILSLNDLTTADSAFPGGWDMPLGWPKPPWGNWSLRDEWVIDVRRIPSLTPGYCYGKRIMYVDKYFYHESWTDLYDADMKLWKVLSP